MWEVKQRKFLFLVRNFCTFGSFHYVESKSKFKEDRLQENTCQEKKSIWQKELMYEISDKNAEKQETRKGKDLDEKENGKKIFKWKIYI